VAAANYDEKLPFVVAGLLLLGCAALAERTMPETLPITRRAQAPLNWAAISWHYGHRFRFVSLLRSTAVLSCAARIFFVAKIVELGYYFIIFFYWDYKVDENFV
jgi:hypothetical protein